MGKTGKKHRKCMSSFKDQSFELQAQMREQKPKSMALTVSSIKSWKTFPNQGKDTRITHNIKQTRTEKIIPIAYYN